jgi:disulfide bond formation protein DsbB
MTISPLRAALLLTGLLSAAALGTALASETWGGLVPCALCLVERWPWRVAIGLSVLGLLLPRRLVGWLLVLTLLAAAVGGFVHAGVEWGWWPSPLPECAAPDLSGLSIAERLARMPATPGKPCDEPTYLIPGLPVSMAQMNLLAGLGMAVALAMFLRHSRRNIA